MIFGFNQGFCYALSGKTIFRSNTHNILKACALTWGYACVHNTICKALSVGHIFIQLHAIPVNYLSKSFLNLVFRSRAYPFFPPNDCAVPEKLGGGGGMKPTSFRWPSHLVTPSLCRRHSEDGLFPNSDFNK